MNTLKKLTLGAICLMLAVSMGFLFGCGQSNEDAIREQITEDFDAYKNLDDAVLERISSSMEDEAFESLGLTSEDYASAILDGFDYNIDSVTVNGSAATAQLSIASKSKADFERIFGDAVNQLAEEAQDFDMSEQEKSVLVGQAAMKSFSETEVLNETLTLNFLLQDGQWVCTNATEALGELDSVIFSK